MASVETPLPGLAEEEQFLEEYEVFDGDGIEGEGGMPVGDVEVDPQMAEAQGCVRACVCMRV